MVKKKGAETPNFSISTPAFNDPMVPKIEKQLNLGNLTCLDGHGPDLPLEVEQVEMIDWKWQNVHFYLY